MIAMRCLTVCAVCLASLAVSLAAQDSTAVRTAHITYLTTATAYLDAGSLDGLRDSARVEVVRAEALVGVLRVSFLASHRASCDILTATSPLVVGDAVRFVPAAPAPDSAAAVQAATTPAPPRAPARRNGVRGRIGVEYLTAGDPGGVGAGYSQPSLAVRLDGHLFAALGVLLAVDVRARRTSTILPDGSAVTDARNRVYQASLSFGAAGGGTRLSIGRQISGNLASVGVFDGLLAELDRSGWRTGLFAGTEPDPLALDWSSAVTEFGLYVQRHSPPGADRQWALTLGASDSYDGGQANREFAYLQGTYVARHLSALLTQEVDYYRPWKLMGNMDAISPTSTFALLRYRVTSAVSLDLGFDNRRNVRLYRDVVNPATAFDDAFRQGVWAGVSTWLGGRYRIAVDARSSSGGPAGRADAYTLSLGADRLTGLGLTLRERTTYYTGPTLTGWLHAATLSVDPGGRLHVALDGGVRQELDPLADPAAKTWATWLGGDVDVAVARAWYAMLSFTRESGGFEDNNQLYGGLSYRF